MAGFMSGFEGLICQTHAKRVQQPLSRRDEITHTQQLAFAALGAAVITTVAVAQGQNPLTALGITVFSAVAAVMVGQVL